MEQQRTGPSQAVHLAPDDGLQAYTEAYPRMTRDGSNQGPFLPARAVVHVVAVRGEWAQVAVEGSPVGWVQGSRLVPPLGGRPAVPQVAPPQSHPGTVYGAGYRPVGNGMAVAALVLGIVGAAFSFLFFLGTLALLLGVLAVIFGWIGLRRSNASGVGSGQAIAGLCLGILAIVVSAYMIWMFTSLFRSVSDAIEQSRKPTVVADLVTHPMTLDRCNTTIGKAEASGTLVNTGRKTANFSVTVTFIGPGGKGDGVGTAYAVAPGATANWFLVGPQVTQLTSCTFGLSPSAPSTASMTRPADPPR